VNCVNNVRQIAGSVGEQDGSQDAISGESPSHDSATKTVEATGDQMRERDGTDPGGVIPSICPERH